MSEKSSLTLGNLNSALAGEASAYMKYRYFAKLARAMGDVATAEIFEETAAQEIHHAFGHLDLIYPAAELTPAKMLELAIAGETYEFTTMYPGFRDQAHAEQSHQAVAEFDAQIEESREHAAAFAARLAKAEKRFAALAKVEQRHAQAYQQQLQRVNGA